MVLEEKNSIVLLVFFAGRLISGRGMIVQNKNGEKSSAPLDIPALMGHNKQVKHFSTLM